MTPLTTKKILIVIPARGGSKGIPNKNTKLLKGQPLISYAINSVEKISYQHKLIISTDSLKIKEIAEEYGAEVPFIRPDHLATDNISIIPVIQHAYEYLKAAGYDADIIISVQPTCPFLANKDINKGIELLIQEKLDSVVSVKEITHGHPYRAKKINKDIITPLFPEIAGDSYLQRQDLPKTYCYSGALYIRTRKTLMSWTGKDFGLGQKIGAVIVPEERSVNIDNPLDFEFAEFMLSRNT